MKGLLILLTAFFCWTQISIAQAYRPFLIDSAHWTIHEYLCVGPCDPADINNPSNYNYENIIRLKIDGDTVVNGATYKRITQNLYRSGPPGPYQPGYFPCNTLGILWEDTTAKKVYINKVNNSYAFRWCVQDSVLFDFSKQAGDTMSWSYACSDSLFAIDSISYSAIGQVTFSVIGLDSNSYPIKTWYLHQDTYYAKFQLYQSIGASLGFWGWTPSFEGPYESILSEYCIGSDSACGFSCDPTLGIIDPTLHQVSIAVYPNPAKDIVTLDINSIEPYQDLRFVVRDILGQEVRSEVITKAKTEVDISAFQPGIYLWHLLSGKNIIRSGKLVHN